MTTASFGSAPPGVGAWTVHGFLVIALDRPDAVLPGDLALPAEKGKGAAALYALGLRRHLSPSQGNRAGAGRGIPST